MHMLRIHVICSLSSKINNKKISVIINVLIIAPVACLKFSCVRVSDCLLCTIFPDALWETLSELSDLTFYNIFPVSSAKCQTPTFSATYKEGFRTQACSTKT